RGQEGAVEVDGEHLLPVGKAEVGEPVDDLDAGVGNQHVDLAVARDDRGDAVDHLAFVGDVHGHGHGLPAGVADRLRGGLGGLDLEIGDGDLAAGGGIDLGDAQADAAGRAGDDADLAVESVHGGFLRERRVRITSGTRDPGPG